MGYCVGDANANCQSCSSYAWLKDSTFRQPTNPLTTNPFESPAARQRGRELESLQAMQTGISARIQQLQAMQDSTQEDSHTTGGSGGSKHTDLIIGVVAGVVGAGVIAGVLFAVYRKHAARQQHNGLQQALMQGQEYACLGDDRVVT